MIFAPAKGRLGIILTCVGASGRRHSVAISSCQRTGTPESLAFACAGLSCIFITAPARRPKPIAKVDNRHTVSIAEGQRMTQPRPLVRLLLPKTSQRAAVDECAYLFPVRRRPLYAAAALSRKGLCSRPIVVGATPYVRATSTRLSPLESLSTAS